MKWLEYFQDQQKQRALNYSVPASPIEYGDCVHKSALFMERRWLVTNFHGEFVVFVEYTPNAHRSELRFVASFTLRDRAIALALKMFLVCCGRLQLNNRYCLTQIAK
jgi:hypothetical protein